MLDSTKMQHVLRFIQFTVGYNKSDMIFGSKQAIRAFYVNHPLEKCPANKEAISHTLVNGLIPIVSFQLTDSFQCMSAKIYYDVWSKPTSRGNIYNFRKMQR